MFVRLAAIFVIGIFSSAVACSAAERTLNETIAITDAHAVMATPTFGAAFGTITSTTKDTLTGVSARCCKSVEIHQSGMLNGVMSMRAISKVAISPKEPILLVQHAKAKTPTSMHIMLIGANQPMAEGDTVDITFHFTKAGDVTHRFPIEAFGAR